MQYNEIKRNSGLTGVGNSLNVGKLQYPRDVEAANGHYMIFNIYNRQQTDKQLPSQDLNVASTQATTAGNTFTRERFFDDAAGSPVTLLSDQVVLYMPDDVSVNYSVNYEAAEVGNLVGAGAAISDFFKGKNVDLGKSLGLQFAKAVQPLISFGTLGGAEGATAAIQRKTGLAAAPMQEMIFQNMNYRSFSYNFKMTPRNRDEAKEINNIIDTFTFHMLPEKIGTGAALAFRVPSEFTIRYMYRGGENNYLNHITFCALTDMKVDYGGGEKYVTYRPDEIGAPPVSTNVSLTFQELEFVDRRRAVYGTHHAARRFQSGMSLDPNLPSVTRGKFNGEN